MFELINRENKIFYILQEFIDAKLGFIIIGGYAISSYKHRFSVDVDLVIKKEDKKKFEEVLINNKFKKTIDKELEQVYSPEFIRYEAKEKLPVSVDLLINGVGSRTTDASWSFEQLKERSKVRKIIGIEKEILARVPDREILIVLKLHSGRLTDFRDIVALCKNLDLKFIKKLIWIGKISVVKQNIKKLLSLLEEKGFIDSFKGVFIEKRYDVDLDEVKRLKALID
ncbi:MAG: hypothetical protein ABIB79_02165 [archaeon]